MAKKSKITLPTTDNVVRESPKESKRHEAMERKYRCEEAMSTLKRADEIRKDKGLMKDVKSYAKEQVKVLNKLT